MAKRGNTDPELDAMRKIAAALNELDRPAQARVMTWLENKFVGVWVPNADETAELDASERPL